MSCPVCGEFFEDDDFKEIHDDDEVLGIPADACPQCKEEMREGVADFIGDNSDFHPDETDEDFWEHEE